MKINPVTAAVAAVIGFAGVSSVASAAPFDPWTSNTANTVLRLSGATAQDKGIVVMMRRLCSAGTMVRVTGTVDSAILCEANGVESAPVPAGNKVILYKNSNGGSSRGVVPVSDQSTTISFLNLASLAQAGYQNTSVCSVTSFASTTDFVAYTEYACGSNVTSPTGIAPDAGISDLEPNLLGWTSGVNQPFGTVTSGPTLMFGAVVSKNFRDALQTAQSNTLPGGCVGSDTEACMPTLTKAQLSNIWSGGIAALSRLSDDAGVLIPTPTGSTSVSVCRRKSGSGTLASYQVYFLNDLCVKSTKAVKAMVTGVDGNAAIPSVASRVNEYSSTPQVIGCLNANHAAGKYAIGMSSTESVPGSAYLNTGLAAPFDDDTGNWRYIKIDGYAPTLLNVAQTRYDFGFEVSFQTKSGLADNAGASSYPLGLFNAATNAISSAAVIKEVNAAFVQTWGQSGFMGRPSAGSSTLPSAAPAGKLTAAEVVANPVNTWTRAASGTPNSCNPPFLSRETGIDR